MSAETERILNILGKRANILDINQERMFALIKRIQIQLNYNTQKLSGQAGLSNLHLQINSVLIHLGDHLNYLYHLLSSGKSGTGINIALSESERYKIIQAKMNTTIESPSRYVIRHRFQMLGEDILCLLMNIPIRTSIRSVGMIQVYPFPIIQENSLWVT